MLTLAAKDKNPARDSRSIYREDPLASIVLTFSLARYSLASSRQASIAIKSSSIPRNSAVVPVRLLL